MKNKSFSTFILTILLIVCTSLGSVSNGLSNMPNIIAESAIVMDMDTGEVYYIKKCKSTKTCGKYHKIIDIFNFCRKYF